ncbi:hypothetical protein BDB01DRAFT_813143 [Pilobolus umbonatus]|nr:hypothetical protein BDB01DRAFT_813143 [Pilobolus umbonatus]
MNDTLDQVREKCGAQLQTYQDCVENNPHTWDKACLVQKKALTVCSEENVGVLKYVKKQCTKQINAYDECIAVNTENPHDCIAALKEIYYCTEESMKAYQASQSK